ncbi:CcdB family protein [Sphingomonas segetis]|jgi:toxin CcdB|uniref:CcdB family protein n=1 Tax=Sphingomonas segetis TaxID=1104779 RepID=UPI0012D2E32C|nr:CcdB family protein [Sphingomonas segetis]
MARFDVYQIRSTGELAVDVQADLLQHLKTRVVVPLVEGPEGDWPMPRLTPKITFDGRSRTFGTPFIIGVPIRELAGPVGSVADQEYPIALALDLLSIGV